MATTDSPSKFVKPADLFRMRHSTNSSPAFDAQSPLKCLNKLTDPSPTKKLPTLLRNPFQNQPAKRRLNLCSPNKRTKMFEIDEDANLEPPKMKHPALEQQTKEQRADKKKNVCFKNDWVLRTKLKINFDIQCKNWLDLSTSTHKRVDNSPSKFNDKTMSIEAIKNIATVYQHPYLAWQSLYPRGIFHFGGDNKIPFKLSNQELAKMMRKDWCESLQDLTNLLLDGKCPYFYLCSDTYTILFKQIPSSNPKRPFVEAYITPFSNGMGLEFNKLDIEFKFCEITLNRNNSSDNISSSSINITYNSNLQSSFSNDSSSQATRNTSKATSSIDSGNGDDYFSDVEDDVENQDATSILSTDFGINDLAVQTKRKKCHEFENNNTQSRTSDPSSKPMALVEGRNNIRKLVKFLHTNETYTRSNVGRFAYIPPTLLSPREFRLSTPQYPEVILSKNMIEATDDSATSASDKSLTPVTPLKTPAKVVTGSSFVELKGTILPNFYKELHKLLSISDNMDNHTCQSTQLETTIPFGSIQLLP